MKNLSLGKIAGGIAVIVIIGLVGAIAINNQGGVNDSGINVSNTPCEGIGAARLAVNEELEARKTKAAENLATDMENASDAFWTQNRSLEDAHNACISEALVADPCKDLFERASTLAQQILNDIDNGFDEAKYQEREQVKKEYEDCLENAPKEKTYEGKKAECDAALAAGQKANEETRKASEASAQAKHDALVATAETAHRAKHGTLDAIEEKCKEPAGNTNVNAGGITTGGTGTIISTGSACSGVFTGNDEDLEKRLRDLEWQLQKAKAGGLKSGLYGSNHLQEAVDEVRQELKESERNCETDSDCGDPEPVCCSGNEVGRVFCDSGTCANERIECDDPEICAGKPAECVDPSTGVGQQDGIYISRSIPEVGSCSQNLQVLNMQKGSSDSDRFVISGNIPSWIKINPPSGKLPNSSVNVTYSCNTVQGFGPGTYTANGSITVFDEDNNLINTIPLTISVEVTPVAVIDDDTTIKIGEDVNLNTNTSPPESAISVGPTSIGFIYDHANPVCPLSITPVVISGPPGSEWYISSKLPIWLNAPNGTSGTVPATVPLQFPCLLNEYKNQQQLSEIPFVVTPPSGDEVTIIIKVSASITNFDE